MQLYDYPDNTNINIAILEVYKNCNVKTFPIDCTSILNSYGFKVLTYTYLRKQNPRLYELSQNYSSDAFKCGNIIAYNEKKPINRTRFSLMHELGHYILGHKKETPACEAEADLFASHILAPRIAIHKKNCRTADQIHDTFGLSYCASNRALLNYRKWFNNIAHTTRRPSAAERQLELLISEEEPEIIDYEEEEENYTPTPEEKYLHIQRSLMAGLPIPAEYMSFYKICYRMGIK